MIQLMRLDLTNPQLERFINDQVKAGHFPTREAVVEDAVTRMMAEDETLSAEDVAAIGDSDRQIDGGEFVEFGDFADQTRKRHGA